MGLADKGLSVGRNPEGKVVFIEGAVPGDVVDVSVIKKRKGYYQGAPERFLKYSDARQDPSCKHFGDCGGCKWQHLRYEKQLEEKERIVFDAIKRIGKIPVEKIFPILPAPAPFFYRNKMEFSFSNQRWILRSEVGHGDEGSSNALGLHPPGFFNKVVDIQECLLMDPLADSIRNFIRQMALQQSLSFYDPIQNHGFLRNMILRNSSLGQWMLVLSFGHEDQKNREVLLDHVAGNFPQISSLHYVINEKKNDTLFDQDILLYAGRPFIEEQLGSLIYKIRPKSFFQTNTAQARRLYDIVRLFADLQKDQVVYDLYTGTGSIALYLAADCQSVIGLEEIPDAVTDARENAFDNGIRNVHFYTGDVRHLFTDELLTRHGRPDVVVTDPPRGGMHAKVVESILFAAPEKIVYISCNPATQARDIQLLGSEYYLKQIQPVDMFPHTSHIENVALLIKKTR